MAEKRLSVKQLYKRLGQEQFDLKNVAVALDLDSGRAFVTGADYDPETNLVLLSVNKGETDPPEGE